MRIAELLARYPEGAGELGLLKNGGEHIAENLRRSDDPLETLFPDGSFDLADHLYRRSPAARTMNLLVQRAVQAVVRDWKAPRPLRILEVGAGTGGTTSFVVPGLPSDRVEYCFTDISPLFVSRAEEEFQRFAFMRYQVLDIEQDPPGQGLACGSADLVVAANVLHATTHLGCTLANVRRLLRPGGLLVLLEGTRALRWIDLTFGFTEGWWRFTDQEVRPAYPLVDRQTWTTLLRSAGFDEVGAALPGRSDGPLALNGLILARVAEESHGGTVIGKGAEKGGGTEKSGHTGPPLQASTSVGAVGPAWIVFDDQAGLGHAVTDQLRAGGQLCATVTAGDGFAADGRDEFVLNPAQPEDFRKLIAAVKAGHQGRAFNILHLWTCQECGEASLTAEGIMKSQGKGPAAILHLVQALARDGVIDRTKLWLFTRGARGVDRTQERLFAPQATVWGLARTIALEHPEMPCVCIDLDPAPGGDDLLSVMDALETSGEGQIAYRRGSRYAARLRRAAPGTVKARRDASSHTPQQLVLEKPGTLDGLARKPMNPKMAGQGQVVIAVEATGLNFRDVLIALGMYPAGPRPSAGSAAGSLPRWDRAWQISVSATTSWPWPPPLSTAWSWPTLAWWSPNRRGLALPMRPACFPVT